MAVNAFKLNILPKLLKSFPSCLIDEKKSSSTAIVMRIDIATADAAENFKMCLSEATNTNWIVYRTSSNWQRLNFSKVWICQHSKKNKKNLQLKRNAECKAKLYIAIKKLTEDTLKRDLYLRQTPVLRSEVKLEIEHTHNTASVEALRMLRVNDEVKECFFDYFSNGMTAAEAIRHHENKFLLDEDFKSLANAAKNPTNNQVQYLHNCWRQENLGSLINPFEKLKEKIPLYETNGTTIHVRDGDLWAIALATSVMKRIQTSEFAREMIFVDSTTGCEGLSSTMTILLAASKIGALPICVLIHSAQTIESYASAFDLVKEKFPLCFGGNDHPEIFMTDDSSAEKGALKRVWEESKQLLCHFHVAQAEWRWLFTHCIPKDERPRLMKLFQAVMYAKTEEELDGGISDILKEEEKYPHFVKRFKTFYNRREEWVLIFRKDLITRQNNTNNFAEISIRILKDIVLCRTKAFNVVALCEFCISVWELYLIKRLLDYAHSRKHEVSILYSNLLKKSSNLTESNIKNINENTYMITSSENNYYINVDVGACTCPAGISGAFCKHQCFLMNMKKIKLPNAPPITQNDRYELALLALGPKCPEKSFFSDFENFEETKANIFSAISLPVQNKESFAEKNQEVSPPVATPEEKEMLTKEFDRLASMVSRETKMTSDDSKRLLNSLKKIQTIEDFKNLYVVKKIGQRTKRIKVQPTSISRRQRLVKSSKKLPSGRPPLSTTKKCVKRKRQLQQNILANKLNAKSHGSGH